VALTNYSEPSAIDDDTSTEKNAGTTMEASAIKTMTASALAEVAANDAAASE
jgi:hypothetical protein